MVGDERAERLRFSHAGARHNDAVFKQARCRNGEGYFCSEEVGERGIGEVRVYEVGGCVLGDGGFLVEGGEVCAVTGEKSELGYVVGDEGNKESVNGGGNVPYGVA